MDDSDDEERREQAGAVSELRRVCVANMVRTEITPGRYVWQRNDLGSTVEYSVHGDEFWAVAPPDGFRETREFTRPGHRRP